MKISTKGRYALRVMVDLAVHDQGEYISLKEIATRQDITIKYLEHILSLLNKSGLIKSSRGNNGGYRLMKTPQEYTVGEILRKTEGSLAPVACLDETPNQCPRHEFCSTISVWIGLGQVINQYLDNITLEDLVRSEIQKVAFDYTI